MKLAGIAILGIFYSIYLGKMFLQKKRGIQTDQMAKGAQKDRVYYTEWILKIATYLVVLVEVLSIFLAKPVLPAGIGAAGAVLGFLGDGIFGLAVWTMRDSWRAGLAERDQTELVTEGIYQFSRNPAFLGFDCVYLGLLLMFFNVPLLISSTVAMIMLHLQILQEEAYLLRVFGEKYRNYQQSVGRYLGRFHPRKM